MGDGGGRGSYPWLEPLYGCCRSDLTPPGRQDPGICLRPQQPRTDCGSVRAYERVLCECMRGKSFGWMTVCQKGGGGRDSLTPKIEGSVHCWCSVLTFVCYCFTRLVFQQLVYKGELLLLLQITVDVAQLMLSSCFVAVKL